MMDIVYKHIGNYIATNIIMLYDVDVLFLQTFKKIQYNMHAFHTKDYKFVDYWIIFFFVII